MPSFASHTKGRQMKKSVKVLGTKYKIKFASVESDSFLENHWAFCDFYSKSIVIRDDYKDLVTPGNEKDCFNETLRHELVHAFLHESGMTGEQRESRPLVFDEVAVAWVATQFPRMLKVFKKLGCI